MIIRQFLITLDDACQVRLHQRWNHIALSKTSFTYFRSLIWRVATRCPLWKGSMFSKNVHFHDVATSLTSILLVSFLCKFCVKMGCSCVLWPRMTLPLMLLKCLWLQPPLHKPPDRLWLTPVLTRVNDVVSLINVESHIGDHLGFVVVAFAPIRLVKFDDVLSELPLHKIN